MPIRHILLSLLAVSAVSCAGVSNGQQEERGWEDAIAAFEAADRDTFPPEGSVLFIGSSSIRMWKTLHEDMAPIPVINRGFGGSHISDVIEYIDRIVIPYRPSRIVFYAGDNDIAAGKPPERVRDDFVRFVTLVRKEFPALPIHFIAIKPSPSRWDVWPAMREANHLIRTFCDRDTALGYFDIATPMMDESGVVREDIFLDDMLHLNAKGYDIWTSVIRPVLLEKWSAHRR